MNEEFNKFLEDIKPENPQKLEEQMGLKEPELPAKAEEEPPEKEEPRKNRHHRRLEAQLERERIARIEAEARANAMAEFNRSEVTTDIAPELVQLYGNEERGKEAARVHQALLDKTLERAREDALKEFESRQTAKEAEVKQFEQYIDSQFEELEDEYNLDLTSNAPTARKARNEILEILEKISPKDDSGNIKEYADIDGVYEMWNLRRSQEKGGVSERQKEAASRGMIKGENSPAPEKKPTAGFDGWRKDYGL